MTTGARGTGAAPRSDARQPPTRPADGHDPGARPTPCAAAAATGLTTLAALLIAVAVLSGAGASWIAVKATLAQVLLERSWRATRAGDAPVRPWPWADILPIARLEVPSADATLIVLRDASGEALAFGPGLVAGDPERAARQPLALGGHRDSHLAFLEHLAIGATLRLEDRAGRRHVYRLASRRVVDRRDGPLSMPSDRPALVLITCWPFRATQTGGPLRLVAVALPVDAPTSAESAATMPVETPPAPARSDAPVTAGSIGSAPPAADVIAAAGPPPLYCRACATPPSSNASPPTAARAVPIRGRSTIAPSPASPPATT